jgi:soluble lytic murein transglycosylase
MHRPYIFIIFIFFIIGARYAAAPIPQEKPSASQTQINKTASEEIKERYRPQLHFQLAKSDKPLNNREIELYRDIIELQKKADWEQADILIKKIDNPVLMGYVNSQRLLHNDYKPSKDDFTKWMTFYADHPQAASISKKTPDMQSQYESRITGTMADLRYFAKGSKYISENYKSGERYELNLVKDELQKYLARGAVTAALNFFNKHRVQSYIDPIDKSQILAEIAAYYLYLGKREDARRTAFKAVQSSDQAPLAGWVMGLTEWMNGNMVDATRFFTMASKAPYASPWMTSAAAYWGARAATRAKLFSDVSPLLARAVRNQRTFYGLIATKAMGYGYDFNWTMPEYTSANRDVLMAYDAGARAIALSQIGDMGSAEDELFALPVKNNPELSLAAIAFANHHNLAGYAMRFSLATPNPTGDYYDGGLYPISSWTEGNKDADIAMLNAFIRQESRFRTKAKSSSGALGLMQVMPDTAAYITEDDGYKNSSGQRLLNTPEINVQIGTDYLNHLLKLDVVDGDLFGLAIAYNAGPGKLARWKKDLKVKDPLLFIELIPSSETRAFVERIATNYWIYQMQMGIEPATLMAVAQGDWPVLE